MLIATDILTDVADLKRPADALIEWRQRYEGVLMVAYLDGKAVAGVSGPWPVNQFALTWWDRPMPARQLELFDSLAAAQRRVEEWAWRMRTIGVIDKRIAGNSVSKVRPRTIDHGTLRLASIACVIESFPFDAGAASERNC